MDHAIFRLVSSGLFQKESLDRCTQDDINSLSSLESTPLHYAVIGGNQDTVRYLVARGARVNARNAYGESVLHWACKEGNAKLTRFLLQHNATPISSDTEGNTPMHWAAEYDCDQVIQMLVEFGGESSCRVKNEDGQTPLEVAQSNHSRKVARTLQILL